MLDDRPYMREPSYGPRWTVTMILIVANAVLFAAQLIAQSSGLARFEDYLALTTQHLAHGWVWQLITFQFLHAGPLHLILNCAMLYMFGRPVEDAIGQKRFLFLYLGSGVAGGLLQATGGWLLPWHFGVGPLLGASAGVFGVIAAFAVLHWETPITTLVAFIIPVTMRAKYLVLVSGVLAILGMLSKDSNIAHAAHLGGLLTGLLGTRWLAGLPLIGWPGGGSARRDRELVVAGSERTRLWRRANPAAPEELPRDEFISQEVDPILDKISAHGIHSLTEREKKILERARAKMSRR